MESTSAAVATPSGEGVETTSSEGIELATPAVGVQWILSAIELRSFLSVCKYFFGRRDIDEHFLGSFLIVALVLVRMPLRCQLSVGLRDFTFACRSLHVENFVIVSLSFRFFEFLRSLETLGSSLVLLVEFSSRREVLFCVGEVIGVQISFGSITEDVRVLRI